MSQFDTVLERPGSGPTAPRFSVLRTLDIATVLRAQDLGNRTIAHTLPVEFTECPSVRINILDALFTTSTPIT